MKRILTRTVSFVVVLMCLFSVILIGVNAGTNSSNNTQFNYNFTSGVERVTGSRAKGNDTSSYMYCVDSTVSYYFARVCDLANETFGYHDFQNIYEYKFIEMDERFMFNEVYENMYPYAVIVAHTFQTGSAFGVWSPDSIPQSGVKSPYDYYSHTIVN